MLAGQAKVEILSTQIRKQYYQKTHPYENAVKDAFETIYNFFER